MCKNSSLLQQMLVSDKQPVLNQKIAGISSQKGTFVFPRDQKRTLMIKIELCLCVACGPRLYVCLFSMLEPQN